MNQIFFMSFLDKLSLLSAVFFTAAIAWQDYRNFRIPNRWVYSFALVSLSLAIARSTRGGASDTNADSMFFRWPDVPDSLLGFLVAFAFTLFFWNRGWMGGGDVKLASALGLCVGFQYVLQVLLLTHVLAFIINRTDDFVSRAVWRRGFLHALQADDKRISMAPFYAASLLFVLW